MNVHVKLNKHITPRVFSPFVNLRTDSIFSCPVRVALKTRAKIIESDDNDAFFHAGPRSKRFGFDCTLDPGRRRQASRWRPNWVRIGCQKSKYTTKCILTGTLTFFFQKIDSSNEFFKL